MSQALAIRQQEEPAPGIFEALQPETNGLPPLAVRQQLDRVLASRAFARSPRISRFLSFVVDQTLAGQEDKLKEYLLGVEVFSRTDSFDPRIDSIVRVEARRLRFKLEKYYETDGRNDPVHIQFRKGCYVPAFAGKSASDRAKGDAFSFPNLHTIDNPEAFALYARGRKHLGDWTADGIAAGVSCFSQALVEDPECAAAHSGLSAAWTLASLLGLVSPLDVLAKARQSAAEAVRLAPGCPEGHAIPAVLSALHDFEWNEAEDRLRRAIPIDPCNVGTRLWYGLCAALAGKSEEASRELHKVRQSDPTSMTAHLAAGFAAHLSRDFDAAHRGYQLALSVAPGHYAPQLALGLLFADRQMTEPAAHALSQAAGLCPGNPHVMAAQVYAYSMAGRHDAARRVSVELADLAARQYVPPLALCLAHSAVGEHEAAIRCLEQAYLERSPWLGLVRALPAFAAVRNDARYPALVARIGLP